MNGTEAFGLFVILPVFAWILKLATDPFQKTEMVKINHSIKLQKEEWEKNYEINNTPPSFDYSGLTDIEAKRKKIFDDIKISLKNKPSCECLLIIQEHKENFICLSGYYSTQCKGEVVKYLGKRMIKSFLRYLEQNNITPNYDICIIRI
jgi:hypothetical protein